MKPYSLALMSIALLVIATWQQNRVTAPNRGTRIARTTPVISSTASAGSIDCGASDCDHDHSAPAISRRIVTSRTPPAWHDAKPGETTRLGFQIDNCGWARVVSRHTFPDERIAIGMTLPSGHDLHVVTFGDEWEGRALSKDGSNGYKLHGRGNEVHVEEVRHEALICAVVGNNGIESAGLPVPKPGDGTPLENPLPEPQSIEIPKLNSLLGANGVIYLDFDGETVSGTQWNSSYNGGNPIVAAESALTATQIERVWEGIAEDYAPFNVNITTDRRVFEGYPVNRRAMLIFSPSIEWYTTGGGVGGVAYVDIFGSSSFDYPGWVFTAALGNNASNCHEAGSHEVGHILGLRHDATSTEDYYDGHGSGTTSWGPIMGVAYNRTVGQFSRGEYNDANNFEDDLAIISKAYNGLGHLPDDHANGTGGASPMIENGLDSIQAEGLIETNTDVDYFSFQTSGGTVVLNASNAAVDPNLDIRMRLLDSRGAQLAVDDLLTTLDATLSANVASGFYYLEISGTGNGNPTTGYSDYGSLGGYTVIGTAPRVTNLAAEILSPLSPQLSLPAGTGLYLDGLTSGGTPMWEVITSPPAGNVVLSSPDSDATRASFTAPGLYRLRLSVSAGPDVESDDIEVSVQAPGSVQTFPSLAPGIDLGPNRNVYNNRIPLIPTVTDDGLPLSLGYEWQVLDGDGQLSNPSIENPELVFTTASTTTLRLSVTDGDHRTFSDLGLTAVFFSSTLVAENAPATTTVSDAATFNSSWKSLLYDDSDWLQGELGVGYDVTKGNEARRIFLPLIGGLDLTNAMAGNFGGCLVRIPFTVSNPEEILSLTLRMKFDDGFIAYLNGIEIARMNVPNGEPSWDTLALNDRFDENGLSAVSFPIDLGPANLVSGTNVLAIHGVNEFVQTSNGNKPDTSFLLLPSLEAIETSLPTSPFLSAVSLVTDPQMRGENDDADGDGRSNLYEHAAGTDLGSSDIAYPMVSPADPTSIAVTLPASPPADVRYYLESNRRLDGDWVEVARREGAGAWQGTQPTSNSPTAGFREVIEFPLPDLERGFFRLRFERIEP